jgi:hypothetical protein
MNESNKKGHEDVGYDIAERYGGVSERYSVITMPYAGFDITDKE